MAVAPSLDTVSRVYGARWIVVAGAALISIAGLNLAQVRFDVASLASNGKAIGAFLLILPIYILFGRLAPRYRHLVAPPIDLTLSMAQMILLVWTVVPITYLAALVGSGFPLIDNTLAFLDQRLFGFDWAAADGWLLARPALKGLLDSIYATLPHQTVALLVLGSLLRPGERNGEFIWLAIVSMALTAVIFIFTPALGMQGGIGPKPIEALMEVRAGQWRAFSFDAAEGIVTFPSFHTTTAIIFTYAAARLHRLAFVAFGALNAMMLVSIPSMGGHYLMDMIGGGAVAGISIAIVYWFRERNRARPRPAWRLSAFVPSPDRPALAV